MMNIGVKKWYQSTTIQGGIINLLVFIDLIFKLQIGSELINSLLAGIFGVIGTIMVIKGRIQASQKIIK